MSEGSCRRKSFLRDLSTFFTCSIVYGGLGRWRDGSSLGERGLENLGRWGTEHDTSFGVAGIFGPSFSSFPVYSHALFMETMRIFLITGQKASPFKYYSAIRNAQLSSYNIEEFETSKNFKKAKCCLGE
jgi:hypothetical protein